MTQRGQVFPLDGRGPDDQLRWAYRYRLGGRGSSRVQRGGYASCAAARAALDAALRERARTPDEGTLAALVEAYLAQHDVRPRTRQKLRWLLGKATAALGQRPIAELRPEEIAAWRMSIPQGHRVEATQALRQVLARAVQWQLLDHNPGQVGVANPARPPREQRPFESWRQVRAVLDQLGTRDRAIVLFATATGLRPGEWIALEWRDIDLDAGVVHVCRAYSHGEIRAPKTRRSLRAVPLQATALEALALLPRRIDSPLVFPAARGGYLDLHNWRARAWRSAQAAAGIEPRRRVYDLRHTFATFALRAGVPTFEVCRYMGTSLAMIERHYGHLARDAHEHAVGLLDELAAAEAVDVGWTSGGRRRRRTARRRGPIRRWEPVREKPSNGLEPLTPSLP